MLAHMPGMGNTSAAAGASVLRTSFVNIQLALAVGFCGMVPIHPETKHDIDEMLNTVVIQYDFGINIQILTFMQRVIMLIAPRTKIGNPTLRLWPVAV